MDRLKPWRPGIKPGARRFWVNDTIELKGQKMKTVIVSRNGEIKLRVPAEMCNGILRHGKNILINSDLIAVSGMTREQVAAKIKIGKITPEIEAMGMRIGDNGNGLIVRWAEDIEQEKQARADAEYKVLPAEVRMAREERTEIDKIYAAAERAEHAKYYDPARICGLRAEADGRLKLWREKYPAAAKEERRDNLRTQADHEDEMASGALTYDCDGSFSPEYQQQRHDEFKANAEQLRQQAAQL